MKRSYQFVLSVATLIAAPCAASFAQDAPPPG